MASFFTNNTSSGSTWTRLASESTVCSATLSFQAASNLRSDGSPAAGVACASGLQIEFDRVDLYDLELEGASSEVVIFAETRI